MLSKRPPSPRSRAARELGAEHGFTLMETLVAMIAGLAVSFALFAILDVSLHQSARIEDKVQADQLGRTAMNRIVDGLHTTCISPELPPVQAESSPTELRYRNAYGQEAVLSKAQEHRIAWTEYSEKKGLGSITDSTYNSNGGSWPTFTFPTAASSSVLVGSNITRATNSKSEKYIFQYYSYATESSGASSTLEPLSTLNTAPLNPGGKLTTTTAPTVASVQIGFITLPSDGNEALQRSAELTSQVTFAFSAPPSETPIEDSPCQ